MNYRVCKVEALDGFRLYLEFADGTKGTVELEGRLNGPLFEPLRDPHVFAEVHLDDFGAPCWENGADVAPDALYREVARGQKPAAS